MTKDQLPLQLVDVSSAEILDLVKMFNRDNSSRTKKRTE